MEVFLKAWGVDGCREGWFYVGLDGDDVEYGVVPLLSDLLRRTDAASPVFVDIPIGLLSGGDRERECDLAARRVLKPHRTSSVFPAPSRQAVYADSKEEAQALNRATLGKGLSQQSLAIVPKIREVDELLLSEPSYQTRVREVHPEVCFWGLSGHPMRSSKKKREGFTARLTALELHVRDAPRLVAEAFLEHGGFDAERDDIIDALAAALCAANATECQTLPADPPRDEEGLRMEMVYWAATSDPASPF